MKTQEVSNNIAYLENTIVEKDWVFDTDPSLSGHTVNVYDVCPNGICSCEYNLSGDKTQLKLCRFTNTSSLCTQEGKKSFTPLFYNVCDGFKIVDDELNVPSLSYDCKKYLSVLTMENKPKMDKIIPTKQSEDYMKVVDEKTKMYRQFRGIPKARWRDETYYLL